MAELCAFLGEVVRQIVCCRGESCCNVLAEGTKVRQWGGGYVCSETGFEMVENKVEQERDRHLVEGGKEPVERGQNAEERAEEEAKGMELRQ